MNVVGRVSLLATAGLLSIVVLLGSVSVRPTMSPRAATLLSQATT
jgi:hypothetical protein